MLHRRSVVIIALGLLPLGATAVAGCATDEAPAKGAPDPVDDEPSVATQQSAAQQAVAGGWTWHSVPDMACGNGEKPTGIGVNPGASDDVLFFFQGGGACWGPDNQACSSLNGFEAGDFKKAVDSLKYGVFSRGDGGNPFAKATWVFIPYCTGDLHGGGGKSQWWPSVGGGPGATWHYRGGLNAAAALGYARSTLGLANASRVTVGGGSAGGYGAVVNFWRFREAYPDVETYLFDDAGFHFTAEESPGMKQAFETWQLQYPAGCTTCSGEYRDIIRYYANEYTTNYQFGFIGRAADDTIATYYYGSSSQASLARFRTNVVVMEDWINALPNSKTFVQKYVTLGLGDPNPITRFFTMLKNANFSHTSTVNYNNLSAYKVAVGNTTKKLDAWMTELVDRDRGPEWKSWSVTHDPNPTAVRNVVSITSSGTVKEPSWGRFTLQRTGPTTYALPVSLALSGTATYKKDYDLRSTAFLSPTIGTTVTIPAGKSSLTIVVGTRDDRSREGTETVIASIAEDPVFDIGTGSATLTVNDND